MAGLVVVLYLTRETIAILLLALIISTAFEPAVVRLEKWHIPRILGTIIIFLIALTILAFVVYAIFPIALLELNSLFRNLSGLADQFLGIKTPTEVINLLSPNLTNVTNLLLSGGVPFLSILGRLLGGVAFAVAVLVLSFYLTVSRDGVEKFLQAVFPESLEDRVLQLYRRTKKRIGRWFQAQIVLSLVVGFLDFRSRTKTGFSPHRGPLRVDTSGGSDFCWRLGRSRSLSRFFTSWSLRSASFLGYSTARKSRFGSARNEKGSWYPSGYCARRPSWRRSNRRDFRNACGYSGDGFLAGDSGRLDAN